MTPKTYLNVLAGVLMLAIAGAGAYGVWSYRQMAEDAAQLQPLKDQLDALQASHTALSESVVRRDEFAAALRQRRQTVTTNLDKAHREDPTARAYLDERIPDSVRRAYLNDAAKH